MRALNQCRVGIIALLLVAVVAVPASIRGADIDEVKNIDGAVVRIKLVGNKLFIAVRSGDLILKDDDGSVMGTLPAGTAIVMGPVSGPPEIGSIKVRRNVSLGMIILSSNKSPYTLELTFFNGFTKEQVKLVRGVIRNGLRQMGGKAKKLESLLKNPGYNATKIYGILNTFLLGSGYFVTERGQVSFSAAN